MTKVVDRKPKNKTSEQIRKRSDHIVKWLLTHPLINLNGLCAYIGWDRGSMSAALDGGRSFSKHVISRAEDVLKDYGFTPLPEDV